MCDVFVVDSGFLDVGDGRLHETLYTHSIFILFKPKNSEKPYNVKALEINIKTAENEKAISSVRNTALSLNWFALK